MSRSINQVMLLGHIGQDSETRFTQGGVARTTFSIATNRRWKDKASGEIKEETDWHRCVLWRSENVSNFLLKGKQVHVRGQLRTRSWDDGGTTRYLTEVIVDDLVLLGGGDQARAASSSPARRAGQTTEQEAPADAQGISDDDVPF